ncbi:hypothetical protein D187_004800 [Cystobacter fuscus DSM 2262]|uniref:Uncharacterized protein n=1 Tax=Cystobacter fuscus (strain ATCC 25194 / DSM 2262 / NBRC 100088 / M29) TaxID=1242864 RepID=S9P3E4_CYSF2|nr:hypothetical protein D187_004800 [Cystobacter fuscus DSM 2262]
MSKARAGTGEKQQGGHERRRGYITEASQGVRGPGRTAWGRSAPAAPGGKVGPREVLAFAEDATCHDNSSIPGGPGVCAAACRTTRS